MHVKTNNRILAIKTIDNVLNKNITEKHEVMGIFGVIVFSKIIFENNVQLCIFLEEVFKIEIPKYIIKSRSLIIGKIQKIIFDQEISETKIVLRNVKKLINDMIREEVKNESNNFPNPIKSDNSKKNENKKLETWLKGL